MLKKDVSLNVFNTFFYYYCFSAVMCDDNDDVVVQYSIMYFFVHLNHLICCKFLIPDKILSNSNPP